MKVSTIVSVASMLISATIAAPVSAAIEARQSWTAEQCVRAVLAHEACARSCLLEPYGNTKACQDGCQPLPDNTQCPKA